jgi:signal transduction histidine kinase
MTADDPGRRGVAFAFAIALPLPLAYAWREPLAALIAFDLLALAEGALGGRVFGTTVSIAIALIVYVFVLALRAERRDFAIGLGASFVLLLACSLLEHDSGGLAGNAFWLAVIPIGIPSVGGRVLRSRSTLNARLREQADELERNRAERERAAVLRERTRIARELHDIVAHDVSVMLVQTQAARRTAMTDPERARGAIAAVEDTGREALGELRRLLGVLRRGDEDLALAPQPSLARLGVLVERIRTAGLAIELEVDGARRPLAPGVDAAAYRIVQEALTSAVQHARARSASVHVTYDSGAVALVVRDDGDARARAHDGGGIVGLRERVALYGGELRAGPVNGKGFELHALLPLAEGA